MKVKDLIKKLQEIDPELRVVTCCNKHGERRPITGIAVGVADETYGYFSSSENAALEDEGEEPTHVDLKHNY